MSVWISAPRTINGGKPLRLLLRQVSAISFSEKSYSDIATMVGAPDPSVLCSTIVYPGQRASLEVAKPTLLLGVYALFTEPNRRWRALLSETPNQDVNVELGTQQILAVAAEAPEEPDSFQASGCERIEPVTAPPQPTQ